MNERIRWLVVLALALSLAAIASAAAAADFRGDEENPRVTGSVDDDVYVAGNDVAITGDVTGEVWAAGREVTMSGTTGGSLLAAAQRIEVPGVVGGTARLMAQSINVGGEVEGDVMAAGQDVEIEAAGRVERDLLLATRQADVIGDVGGDIRGGAGRLSIAGTVGGDVEIDADEVRLEAGARVQGDLIYRSANTADIDDDATVTGRVVRRTPVSDAGRDNEVGDVLLGLLRSIAGGLILGLVLLWLLPGFLPSTQAALRSSPLLSLGVGLAALVLIPIAAIVLFVVSAVIGAGFSVPMMLLVAYMFLLLLSRVIVAVTFGSLIMRVRRDGVMPSRGRVFLALLVGVVILAALSLIPRVGGLIDFIVALFAMGAAILAFFRWRRGQHPGPEVAGRPATAPPAPVPASTTTTATAEP